MTIGTVTLALTALALGLAARFPIAPPWLLWAALSLAMVTYGYFGVGARVVGKRFDGTIPWWRGFLFFPYC